jgi:hypothetical protein
MRVFLHTLFTLVLFPHPGWGLDVLHLQGGNTVEGKVEAITHETVDVHLSVDLGGGRRGGVKRVYPLAGLEYIEFGASQEESRLLKLGSGAPREALQKLWDGRMQFLGQARSNIGRVGLLYVEVLLKSDSPYHWRQAKALCDLIAEKSWKKEDRDDARIGLVRVLVRQGELTKASRAASREMVAKESEQAVIDAHLLLGEIGVMQLRELQRENPKWEEDDELRPQRMRIYHETLDHFLDTFLFRASWDEAAARGLLGAAGAYRFAGDSERAAQCLEDVVQAYPSTSAASKAAEELKSLKR